MSNFLNKIRKKKGYIICILIVIIMVMGIGCSIHKQYMKRLPIYYAQSAEPLEMSRSLRLEECYITNKVTGINRYFIDDDRILWGQGGNDYGQLANGRTAEMGVYSATPNKIAEDVVSVDCSINGYFAIFLTSEGDLYGMGANMDGLLRQPYNEAEYLSMDDSILVTKPVLLMEDVLYARAGKESITVLKSDGSVWWWGTYLSTYATSKDRVGSMHYKEPVKLLDNCVYATTGNWMGAAIDEQGDLYTWGCNIFGQCGAPVTGLDYIEEPTKVLENVEMVWVESIGYSSAEQEIPESVDYQYVYEFNTFVRLEDGGTMAVGKNLGNKQKTIEITGDLEERSTQAYSDEFVPIRIEVE